MRILFVSLVQGVFIRSWVKDFVNFRSNVCPLLYNSPVILLFVIFLIFLAFSLLFWFILEMDRYSLLVNVLMVGWRRLGITLSILRTVVLTLETSSGNVFNISQMSMVSGRDMETVVAMEVMFWYIVRLNRFVLFCFTLKISLMFLFNKIMSRL